MLRCNGYGKFLSLSDNKLVGSVFWKNLNMTLSIVRASHMQTRTRYLEDHVDLDAVLRCLHLSSNKPRVLERRSWMGTSGRLLLTLRRHARK